LVILDDQSRKNNKKKIRNVQIEDTWEHFKIKFSILDASEDDHGSYMSIIGSTPNPTNDEVSATPPIKMQKVVHPINWLNDKYGTSVRPWEITIDFESNEIDLPHTIKYKY
jgi:hypothetical protein